MAAEKNVDIKIFGKPSTREYRRMGVVLVYGDLNSDIDEMRKRAAELASEIKLIYK